MKEINTDYCENCTKEIFLYKDGEHSAKYEDMLGTIPHTKLRCEINQVLEIKLNHVEKELNQLKEKMGLL